jgi:hypothetical protein
VGGARGANVPPVFYLPKNIFVLATELKRGKLKNGNVSKRLFGWCKDRKKLDKPIAIPFP